MTSVFLTAEWRWLLMLSFPVEPSDLRKYTPRGTEIDRCNGTALISLVAFRFQDTRVRGFAVPFHRSFEEINLRFYVRARAPEGWRRGVVFVREIVPKRAIAAVARWLYNEEYMACPTFSSLAVPSSGARGSIEYGWRCGGDGLSIRACFKGEPRHPEPGSQEQFITEHYWGYSIQRDGGTMEYRVEHPPWRVWTATESFLEGDLAGFYGTPFSSALASAPVSAFVADGSRVKVHKGIFMQDDLRRNE